MPRIRIVRSAPTARVTRMRLLVLGALGIALVAVGAAHVSSAFAGGTTGSVNATIDIAPLPTLSLTVSPASFTYCSPQAGLTFPNGQCTASSAVTITYGNEAGHVDVTGADAVPNVGNVPWTLCGGTGPVCTGTDGPGPDQYFESAGVFLTKTAQCDTDFVAGGTPCDAAGGQSVNETFGIEGPSTSTSDGASSFSTSITWTAVP